MRNRGQIGFSQRIKLPWLEYTAKLVLAGSNQDQIYSYLQNLLKDQLSVGRSPERGNREKAITILMKIWVAPQTELEEFRNEGLDYLRRLPPNSHLPIHWGMIMAVYPFFRVVAETVGRLLRLQGSVAAVQAQRRIREQFGQRETVARAARRVLRCFIDWGILLDTNAKGIYKPSNTLIVDEKKLAVWLLESLLRASESRSIAIKSFVDNPIFFPFSMATIGSQNIETNSRLELLQHGLDEYVVRLRMNRRTGLEF